MTSAGIHMFPSYKATAIIINFLLAFILLQTVDWTIANEFEFFNGFPNTISGL
jgi:hypothetical protein